MKRFYLRVLVAFSLLWSFQNIAFGWGEIGHKLVASIAEKRLTATAEGKILVILGRNGMQSAGVWSDEARNHHADSLYMARVLLPKLAKDYRDLKTGKPRPVTHIHKSWHFTTIPDGKKYSAKARPREKDIVWVIDKCRQVLEDRSMKYNRRAKRSCLRTIIHMIGDIHQPLHVGNGVDRGGNSCTVSFFKSRYQNLHSMIDSKILKDMKLNSVQFIREWKGGAYRALQAVRYYFSHVRPRSAAMRKQLGRLIFQDTQGNNVRILRDPARDVFYRMLTKPVEKEVRRGKRKVTVWDPNATVVSWANESAGIRHTAYPTKMRINGKSRTDQFRYCIPWWDVSKRFKRNKEFRTTYQTHLKTNFPDKFGDVELEEIKSTRKNNKLFQGLTAKEAADYLKKERKNLGHKYKSALKKQIGKLPSVSYAGKVRYEVLISYGLTAGGIRLADYLNRLAPNIYFPTDKAVADHKRKLAAARKAKRRAKKK